MQSSVGTRDRHSGRFSWRCTPSSLCWQASDYRPVCTYRRKSLLLRTAVAYLELYDLAILLSLTWCHGGRTGAFMPLRKDALVMHLCTRHAENVSTVLLGVTVLCIRCHRQGSASSQFASQRDRAFLRSPSGTRETAHTTYSYRQPGIHYNAVVVACGVG